MLEVGALAFAVRLDAAQGGEGAASVAQDDVGFGSHRGELRPGKFPSKRAAPGLSRLTSDAPSGCAQLYTHYGAARTALRAPYARLSVRQGAALDPPSRGRLRGGRSCADGGGEALAASPAPLQRLPPGWGASFRTPPQAPPARRSPRPARGEAHPSPRPLPGRAAGGRSDDVLRRGRRGAGGTDARHPGSGAAPRGESRARPGQPGSVSREQKAVGRLTSSF